MNTKELIKQINELENSLYFYNEQYQSEKDYIRSIKRKCELESKIEYNFSFEENEEEFLNQILLNDDYISAYKIFSNEKLPLETRVKYRDIHDKLRRNFPPHKMSGNFFSAESAFWDGYPSEIYFNGTQISG